MLDGITNEMAGKAIAEHEALVTKNTAEGQEVLLTMTLRFHDAALMLFKSILFFFLFVSFLKPTKVHKHDAIKINETLMYLTSSSRLDAELRVSLITGPLFKLYYYLFLLYARRCTICRC